MEAAERIRELADERPQHALGEWLLQLDLLETARALIEGGEALGDHVLAGAWQIQAGDDETGAGRGKKCEQHDELPYTSIATSLRMTSDPTTMPTTAAAGSTNHGPGVNRAPMYDGAISISRPPMATGMPDRT